MKSESQIQPAPKEAAIEIVKDNVSYRIIAEVNCRLEMVRDLRVMMLCGKKEEAEQYINMLKKAEEVMPISRLQVMQNIVKDKGTEVKSAVQFNIGTQAMDSVKKAEQQLALIKKEAS